MQTIIIIIKMKTQMVNYRNACDVGMQNPSTVWAKAWLDTWITSPDV